MNPEELRRSIKMFNQNQSPYAEIECVCRNRARFYVCYQHACEVPSENRYKRTNVRFSFIVKVRKNSCSDNYTTHNITFETGSSLEELKRYEEGLIRRVERLRIPKIEVVSHKDKLGLERLQRKNLRNRR